MTNEEAALEYERLFGPPREDECAVCGVGGCDGLCRVALTPLAQNLLIVVAREQKSP